MTYLFPVPKLPDRRVDYEYLPDCFTAVSCGYPYSCPKLFPDNSDQQTLNDLCHVELFHPPLDPLNDDNAAGTEVDRAKSTGKTPSKETEDTISLDTKDKKYNSYAKIIKERLMSHWIYPDEAMENLIEGEVMALFSLNRQGRLKDIKIIKTSAYPGLEGETLRTIRSSAPFTPFPGSMTVTKLNIRVSFAYRLTAQKQVLRKK